MSGQRRDACEALSERIAKGQVPPVIWLYGDDEARGRAILEQLRARLVPQAVRAFNEASLDGRDVPMDRVLEMARSMPMLSPWRLLVVYNASDFRKEEWELALGYFQRPCPTTCLVLWAHKPPSPDPIALTIREKGAVVQLRPRSELGAQAWVRERVARERKRITTQAVRAVVERAGTHEAALEGEIQKLVAFVGEREVIQECDVQDVAAEVRTHALFELTQALGEHRAEDALRILHQALEKGTAPLAVVGMLAKHLRLLCAAVASAAWSSGAPRPEVQAFVWERLLKQARGWSESRLLQALRGLLEVDTTIKSGRLDPELLLDRWILQVAGAKSPRPG